MNIKIDNLVIELKENGEIMIMDKINNVYLGCAGGKRFDTLEQVLKTARELKYLKDLGDKDGDK